MTELFYRKSDADLRAEVARFNNSNGVGSRVTVKLASGGERVTTVARPATLHCGNTPVVELAGLPVPVALRDVTAVAPKQEDLL